MPVATPMPEVPVKTAKIGICANCQTPIMQIEGVTPDGEWSHGMSGSPDCEAKPIGFEAAEAAQEILKGGEGPLGGMHGH